MEDHITGKTASKQEVILLVRVLHLEKWQKPLFRLQLKSL